MDSEPPAHLRVHYAETGLGRPGRSVQRPNSSADCSSEGVPECGEHFFETLRHQSHYFSNADLFKQSDLDFNYLKYAKAAEMPARPAR